MMISSYFGEENLNSCGTCDYCRNKKKVMADEEEQENIKKFILGQLTTSNLLPIEIYNLAPDNYKQQITATIQKLLETEVLIFDGEEKLSLNNKEK